MTNKPDFPHIPLHESGIELREDWKEIAKTHMHSITEEESKEWNRELKEPPPEEGGVGGEEHGEGQGS